MPWWEYYTPPDGTFCALPAVSERLTKADIRQQLERIGYKTKTSLSRDALISLLHHHHLEHTSYHKCTDDDLQKFTTDRGLVSEGDKAPRAQLIATLVEG